MRQNACRDIRQRFHFFFCREIESSPEFHVQRFKFAHAEIVIFQEFIILQILEIRYKTANIGDLFFRVVDTRNNGGSDDQFQFFSDFL